MGANAQTSVPAFTSGQVLTAAQVTGINTGIPVFASSTERDAAFGGSGEKTLAEGQMAYLEDTNETQYYDGSSWAALGGAGGLVFISRTTVGSAVSSATVSGAFSSTYDNYRILVSGVDASATTNLKLTFGATSTGYYGSQKYDLFSGTNGIDRKNNGDSILICVTSVEESTSTSFDVHSPNLAIRTNVSGTYHSNGYTGWFGGQLADTNQYTAFTITTGTGTITGGTIDLYGYAKA